jgi:hypothetical protein
MVNSQLCCEGKWGFILTFYIFGGEKLHDDYIQNCKPCSFMAMQKKAWMTLTMFKEFISLFKRSILSRISQSNCHLLILNGHGFHVSLEAIK